MAEVRRLNAKMVVGLVAPGYYTDGDGLVLQVSKTGSKSWLFRYKRHGRVREMGLGKVSAVTLEAARQKAATARAQLAAGVDPLAVKDADRRASKLASSQRMLFRDALASTIEVKAKEWKGGLESKHAQQWTNTLKQHAATLMPMDVRDIETSHVVSVLSPIWSTKAETASRIRQRIENVMAWATTAGYRSGENPARLAGHLELLLGQQNAKVRHFAALPWQKMPAFVKDLGDQAGVAARALEFLIATGARTSEVTGLTWAEIDEAAALWTCPPERMKAKRPHRVPLSSSALAVLKGRPKGKPDELVFPSPTGKEFSDAAMAATLKRMGYETGSLTVHGMRSSLRTWISEATSTPTDVAEAVLAHEKRGAVQKSYERTDFLAQRKPLMQRWSDFLAGKATDASVLPFANRA